MKEKIGRFSVRYFFSFFVLTVTFLMVALLPAKTAMAGEFDYAVYDNTSGYIDIAFKLEYTQYVNVYAYYEGIEKRLLKETKVTGDKNEYPYKNTCYPDGGMIRAYKNHKDNKFSSMKVDEIQSDYKESYKKYSVKPSNEAGVKWERAGGYVVIKWYAKDILTDKATGKLKDIKIEIEIKALGFPDKNGIDGYSECEHKRCNVWEEFTESDYETIDKSGSDTNYADLTVTNDKGEKKLLMGLYSKPNNKASIIAAMDPSKCGCTKGRDFYDLEYSVYCHIDEKTRTTGRNWTWTSIPPWNMRGDVMIIPDVSGDVEIDYNILERKIKFELGETSALTGGPPQGSWVSGSANGTLNIENNTPEIYQNFSFEGNTVSGKTPPVTVNPLIRTTLRREDFGDDPRVEIYGKTAAKVGEVRGSGSVSAEYTWKVTYRECDDNGDGTKSCSSYTVTYYGSTSGPFSPTIIDRKNIVARVYNGLTSSGLDYKAMVAKPLNKTILPGGSAFPKNLSWVSMNGPDEPITFGVVRLMYFQKEDDTLEKETIVGGQYDRYFKWQNTAKLTAEVAKSYYTLYDKDREEARKRNYNYYPLRAVFASDLIYNKGEREKKYPIRSGFYFNPTGEYTFTIESTVYKDSNGSTQEHEDLVYAMIGAFRYESNMVYIDPSSKGREAISIYGTEVKKTGTTYGPVTDKRADNISVNDPGFLGEGFIDYNIKSDPIEVKEMPHSGYPSFKAGSGYNTSALEIAADESFRRNMEGYSVSGTSDSRYAYKYAEFVEKGVKIYEIKEKTTVTITVNPGDLPKVYTHAEMKNGKYYVRAYIGEVELSSPTYEQLSNINESNNGFTLDELEIDVIGSMYDDTR